MALSSNTVKVLGGLALAFSIGLAGCASVSTSSSRLQQKPTTVNLDDGYSGPKKRVQVVSFDMPDSLLKRYPELREKRIGWGIANRIVDAFYETNRFQFIEEKDAMLGKILKNWAMAQTGAVADSSAVKTEGLTAPHYLVYAEVFEFSVGSSEEVTAITAKREKITRVGIQIRLVDVATGEYIPASGTGEEAITKNSILWASSNETFDQSAVGKATQTAINSAVYTLIKRIQ
jgi:curli biogenesis system outer membrane secretion channel CsgG